MSSAIKFKDLDTGVNDKLNLCSDENRTLQTKHDKTCAENKIIKQDKETRSKHLNSASSRKAPKMLLTDMEKK